MSLSGFMNAPTEPDLISLRHDMEYLMHHPHEYIMNSRKKSIRTNEIPHQCFMKVVNSEINKNQEYINFLHNYFDADHARYIYDR